MGAYLNKPVTDKESEDMENEVLVCGASTMQGWRDGQEDAHNCILDFDTNTSLFAVYDGHGGVDVAQYAAKNLPTFVKNKLYKTGDYKKALIKAYLDFDDALLEPSVIDELTVLRGSVDNEEEFEEEEEPEELNELRQEAQLPIDEIIKKYINHEPKNVKSKDKDNQPGSSNSSISKSKLTSEVVTGPSGSSSSSISSDNQKDVANGVDESNLHVPGSTAEDTKLNGTSNNAAECGPSSSSSSSSQGLNGSEEKPSLSSLSLLLNDDESDDDDDDEEDDKTFEMTNDESNSEEESGVGDDGDGDDDDDDDNIQVTDDLLCDDDEIDDADDEEEAGKDSGTTAVVALLVDNKLFVANAGDSRCVLSVDGKAYDMSTDHKPEDKPESKRIVAAGGKVTSDGRVNGGLNLSRALGDHNYKKNTDLPNTEQMVTALPEVSIRDIEPGNQNFIVLACDGIWNSLSSQEVVDFITERISTPNIKLSKICEELFDHCLAPDTLSDGTGCDNMTCIIVKLKQNQKRSRSESENDKCDESVENKKLKSDD